MLEQSRAAASMTADSNTRFMKIRIAAILLVCVAVSAEAQTQPPPLNLQLPQAPAYGDTGPGATPSDDYDDASGTGTGTSVHGSFTSGVGYSKAYGNSTFNAAELNVSKQYGDGKTLDMHFDVTRITGLPAVAPRCFGSPYCGY
jgi:hypothetical protein